MLTHNAIQLGLDLREEDSFSNMMMTESTQPQPEL